MLDNMPSDNLNTQDENINKGIGLVSAISACVPVVITKFIENVSTMDLQAAVLYTLGAGAVGFIIAQAIATDPEEETKSKFLENMGKMVTAKTAIICAGGLSGGLALQNLIDIAQQFDPDSLPPLGRVSKACLSLVGASVGTMGGNILANKLAFK